MHRPALQFYQLTKQIADTLESIKLNAKPKDAVGSPLIQIPPMTLGVTS